MDVRTAKEDGLMKLKTLDEKFDEFTEELERLFALSLPAEMYGDITRDHPGILDPHCKKALILLHHRVRELKQRIVDTVEKIFQDVPLD